MARGPLPLAPIVRLARDAGAKRVSQKGKRALLEVVLAMVQQVGESAAQYANMSGRATVMEKDIEAAYNDLRTV